MILRQAAGKIKQLIRGRDMVARFGGDTFAVLLNQTTLHDALPIAERVRKTLEDAFSHGTRPLRVTASVGIAQLQAGRNARPGRVAGRGGTRRGPGGRRQRLLPPRRPGLLPGVVGISGQGSSRRPRSRCRWPRCGAIRLREADSRAEACATMPLPPNVTTDPTLTGRSLFAANLSRRLAEWKRGGAGVSVAVMRVDQMDELVEPLWRAGPDVPAPGAGPAAGSGHPRHGRALRVRRRPVCA